MKVALIYKDRKDNRAENNITSNEHHDFTEKSVFSLL